MVSGYVVLVAQFDWEKDKFKVTKVNCDYELLKKTGKTVGVAIRVGTGSRSATGGWGGPVTTPQRRLRLRRGVKPER